MARGGPGAGGGRQAGPRRAAVSWARPARSSSSRRPPPQPPGPGAAAAAPSPSGGVGGLKGRRRTA